MNNQSRLCRCIVDITDHRLLSFRGNLKGCVGVILQDYGDNKYLVMFAVIDEVPTLTILVSGNEISIFPIVINDHSTKEWKL